MTTAAVCHLTQDELDELLLGAARADLREHCAACASCAARIDNLSESIHLYNQASLAWAEARSHTFTRDLSGHKPTRRLTAFAARSLAATLVLGVLASLTAGTRLWTAHLADSSLEAALHPAVRAFAPETRAQQIARDNAMLDAIDAELTEPESAPPALLHTAQNIAATTASAQDRD